MLAPDTNPELRALLEGCQAADDPTAASAALTDWLIERDDPRAVLVQIGIRLWQLDRLVPDSQNSSNEARRWRERFSAECYPVLQSWLGFPITWNPEPDRPAFWNETPLLNVSIQEVGALLPKLLEAFNAGWVWRLMIAGTDVDEVLAVLRARKGPLRELSFYENSALRNGDLTLLREIPHLRELDFHGTRVSDEGLRHLHSIPTLRFIDLVGTRVTDAGVAALEAALPECEVWVGG
jgi:hypothetical protein